MKRRTFITTGFGLSALGLGAAIVPGVNRGFRFPAIQYEPQRVSNLLRLENNIELTAEGASVVTGQYDEQFRAWSPQPTILVRSQKQTNLSITVGNIHPDAKLQPANGITRLLEDRDGLKRTLTGTIQSTGTTQLDWKFPRSNGYRFAVIGDTGGGEELAWCIKRGADLDVDFLLHLGDFYYEDRDLESAPLIMRKAPYPIYASIGNHDFHDGFNKVHAVFTKTIGPRNFSFILGNYRFVNIDTAAASLPVSKGERGKLLNSIIIQSKAFRDLYGTIVFTHMPLTDPRSFKDPTKNHNISEREQTWLRNQLTNIRTTALLAGHVHVSDQFDEQGIPCYIAGEGLAFPDIIENRKASKILVGTTGDNRRIAFEWQPLMMPDSAHCNSRIKRMLTKALGQQLGQNKLKQLCGNRFDQNF